MNTRSVGRPLGSGKKIGDACIHGHLLTKANIIIDNHGWVRCKICRHKTNKASRIRCPQKRKYRYVPNWKRNNDSKLRNARDKWDRANNPQRMISDRIRSRIRTALVNGSKSMASLDLLGCSMAKLVDHLLKPFPEGSSLKQLLKTHHIDHIKPCYWFDLTKPLHQMKCFHYTNLQLLPASVNIRKGTNFIWL